MRPTSMLATSVMIALALAAASPSSGRAHTTASVRRAAIGSIQIMLINDKSVRACYGCASAAQSQTTWSLVLLRRFPGPSNARTLAEAKGGLATIQAMHWWGRAAPQLANDSSAYDSDVHRAIRYAWQAATLLKFRGTLQALLLAADCPDWYRAATLPAYVSVTPCIY